MSARFIVQERIYRGAEPRVINREEWLETIEDAAKLLNEADGGFRVIKIELGLGHASDVTADALRILSAAADREGVPLHHELRDLCDRHRVPHLRPRDEAWERASDAWKVRREENAL